MIRISYIGLLIFTGGFASCIIPYELDNSNYEKILVIEGQLSDADGPHQVIISYTYSLDTVVNEYVDDATVWIEDQDGATTYYTADGNGIYNSPDNFSGVVGSMYQLHITMENGDEYISEQELLNASPAIDTIYGSYFETENYAGDANVGAIQFFIDAEESDQSYFRYEWTEAYKIIAPYPAKYIVQGGTLVPVDSAISVCYLEDSSNTLLYGTTNNTTSNKVNEFPIRVITEEDQQLRIRYTLLVRQFAISESAYLFYKEVKENNESGGTLFDKQNGNFAGNITCTTDASCNVLGYFEAAGLAERRQFFTRLDVDQEYEVPSYLYNCNGVDLIESTLDSLMYYYVITNGNVTELNLVDSTFKMHTVNCTDCSFYANLTPPSYWEE